MLKPQRSVNLCDSDAHETSWEEKTVRMEKKMRPKRHQCELTDAALEKIEEALKAVQLCEGQLTQDGYKEMRARLGHLMDTLYRVGESLARST